MNGEIRANTLRVVNADGTFLGVISREEALEKAREAGTDIVEIAPKAAPPVAKIIDFGKFRYAEEKKLREQKKKTKAAELKEIRFSPFIADGDFQTRIRRIDEFLEDSHKVRVVVVFKGRHMGSRPKGYELMNKVLDTIEHEVSIDMEPKFLGRHLAMVISPLKHKKADTKNVHVKVEEG